jgi:ribonuclease HII
VDEAGRGPLAGPVVAAAVILDYNAPIDGIDDSKKLSATKRERLFEQITSRARAWHIALATPEEIDRINILQASLLAMHRALQGLAVEWQLVLVDGNQYMPQLDRAVQSPLVSGDALSASIGAASILAKVSRDRMMVEYDTSYPGYGFAKHKGYPTAQHRSAVQLQGLSPIHRKSFCHTLVAQTRLALD